MTIRLAQLDDERDLRRLYSGMLTELVQFDYDIQPTDENVETAFRETFLPAIGKQEPILVAEESEGVVGAIFWCRNKHSEQAWGHGIYVAKSHRKLGIGARLLKAAKEQCRNLGIKRVMDMVAVANTAAVNTLVKAGIEPAAIVFAIRV